MFSGGFSIWHWLIVLLIVVLIFGTRKLRSAGSDLGAAVRNFKQSMNEGEAEAEKKINELPPTQSKAGEGTQQQDHKVQP